MLFIYVDKACPATKGWKGNTATGLNDRHKLILDLPDLCAWQQTGGRETTHGKGD